MTHDDIRNPQQTKHETHLTCNSKNVFYSLKAYFYIIWIRTKSMLGFSFTLDQQ